MVVVLFLAGDVLVVGAKMRKKANWCLECQHHSFHGEYSEILKCAKGHRPKFYKPKDPWGLDGFGWKRVCSDYKEIKS